MCRLEMIKPRGIGHSVYIVEVWFEFVSFVLRKFGSVEGFIDYLDKITGIIMSLEDPTLEEMLK
jgi:hypothetical protein